MAAALALPAGGFDPDRGLGRAAIYSGALHLLLLVVALYVFAVEFMTEETA